MLRVLRDYEIAPLRACVLIGVDPKTVRRDRPPDHRAIREAMKDVAGIPNFGYKSSIAICRAFGFIRKCKVTDGARFDGRMLRDVVTNDNTASDVWADTAYRSQANEKWLKAQGRVSRIHRKKPRGKPMPDHVRRGNATKSKVRARVEHVFAQQKAQMGLFIRTIGIKRAEAKITLANLAYNMNRLVFHERRAAMG